MPGSTITYESRTVVRRPIEEVFERLADLDHYRDWMHHGGLFGGCSATSTAPVRLGTTYVDHTRMGTYHGTVTACEAPTHLAFSETLTSFGRRLAVAKPAYVLVAEGTSTVVHHVAVGELYGPMRLMKPMAALMARWERSRTVRSLKRSLESEPAAVAQG